MMAGEVGSEVAVAVIMAVVMMIARLVLVSAAAEVIVNGFVMDKVCGVW